MLILIYAIIYPINYLLFYLTTSLSFPKIRYTLGGDLVQNITIYIRPIPIFHSDYIKDIMTLEQLSKKEQKLYQMTSLALHELVKSDVSLEYIDFFIDEKRFSPSLVYHTSMSELLKDIHNKNYQLREITSLPSTLDCTLEKPLQQENIRLAKRLMEMVRDEKHPEFYYYQLPIKEEELFTMRSGYKKIREEYLPYLRFFDLSKITFSQMDFRDIDFSDTNMKNIDFSTAYQHSIENSNFENVELLGTELKNIDARGANLCGTYLTIDSDTTLLENSKLDSSILMLSQNYPVNPERLGYSLEKQKINIKLHF